MTIIKEGDKVVSKVKGHWAWFQGEAEVLRFCPDPQYCVITNPRGLRMTIMVSALELVSAPKSEHS